MRSSSWSAVTATFACLFVALAGHGCAQFSSPDCAARATCVEIGSDAPSGDSGGPPPTGDDGRMSEDATVDDDGADDTGESGANLEAAGDTTIGDAESGMSPGDACLSTEGCTDGGNGGCGGQANCGDSSCSAYTCTPAPPNGWMGPALLWTGAFGSTAPACPAGYTVGVDAFAGPTGASDTCSCTCTASGQTCSTTQTIFSDQTCQSSCAAAVASNATCPDVSMSTCGSGGSLKAAQPTPSGGACVPQVKTTAGPPPSWTTSARVCAWGAPLEAPDGCVAGSQCVLAPTPGFGAPLCIYQAGAATCPTAYPHGSVFFSGETDSRTCAGCICSGIVGGSCSGNVNIYSGATCGTAAATYSSWNTCQTYNVGPKPHVLQGSFTVSPGTCTVTVRPTATGGVTGTAPTTVCCR